MATSSLGQPQFNQPFRITQETPMNVSTPEAHRRLLLQSVAGVATGALPIFLASAAAAVSATGAGTSAGNAAEGPSKSGRGAGDPPPGKPGDFDFLAGEWRIRHRRLDPATAKWEEFEGEATCWTILGGVGNVEELRIPARNFSGLGLRLLDVKERRWRDFWVNAKSGVLAPPGMPGHFINGDGIFEADDSDGDKPIKVRGIWDQIAADKCRWRQAVSRDAGKSWEENWVMQWARVRPT
jgi:hypothetical protein